MISSLGLGAIVQAVIGNKKLKYLDIAGNFIQIEMLHSLRQLFEKNHTLQYLFISDLHKWHVTALTSLAESLACNKAMKLVNLKSCTRACYQLFCDIAPHIKFIVDCYVKTPTIQ